MKEGKALLVMSLIARRASSWMHDIVTSRSINNGEVDDEAMQRFAADIEAALDIIDEPERGNWCEPDVVNQQLPTQEGK